MPTGYILLIIVAILIYFGLAERLLDRMRLTDRAALIFIAAMVVGSFLPNIPLGKEFSINIGGGIIPLLLVGYLIFTADTGAEKVRAIGGGIGAALVIYIVGKILPPEPGAMFLDPIYVNAIIAGSAGYLLGRSRRGAFCAGILGIILNDVFYFFEVLYTGTRGGTAIGGAGIFDTIVISSLIAVLLAEVVGETREKLQGGTSKKQEELEFAKKRGEDGNDR
jgi:uncharacterized membrane protein